MSGVVGNSRRHIFSCRGSIVNIGTPAITAVIILKFEQFGFYPKVIHPKEADRMTNSVDPDQTTSSVV